MGAVLPSRPPLGVAPDCYAPYSGDESGPTSRTHLADAARSARYFAEADWNATTPVDGARCSDGPPWPLFQRQQVLPRELPCAPSQACRLRLPPWLKPLRDR
jgi:hypothetical protein